MNGEPATKTQTPSTWKRDILAIPLVIGLVLIGAGYFVPKWLEKGKKISYTIDGPTAYLNSNAVGTVEVTVNGIKTPNIFGYRVRLWNSGSVPLTSLPVRFSFETSITNFTIFNVTHETIPKKEFGRIDEVESDHTFKRFVFELLNPKDEDILIFLVNSNPRLSVFAKAEGLKTELVEANAERESPWLKMMLLVGLSVMTFLTAVMVYRERRFASALEKSFHEMSEMLAKAKTDLEKTKK